MLWCCYGEDGCKGYAIKTWQLNEAVLTASQQRKHTPSVPEVEKIDYWWLDEFVGSIEPTLDNHLIVRWKDGNVSVTDIPIRCWAHEPERVLSSYKNYLSRIERKKAARVQSEGEEADVHDNP